MPITSIWGKTLLLCPGCPFVILMLTVHHLQRTQASCLCSRQCLVHWHDKGPLWSEWHGPVGTPCPLTTTAPTMPSQHPWMGAQGSWAREALPPNIASVRSPMHWERSCPVAPASTLCLGGGREGFLRSQCLCPILGFRIRKAPDP